MTPSVSVIIPTLNRHNTALATVRAMEEQTIKSFELIVLDQSSVESERLRDFRSGTFSYFYHHIEEQGLPNARNVAASIAHGDILVFIDDDITPERDLVEHYSRLFNEIDDSIAVIGGRIYEKDTRMFKERSGLAGGKITFYGKTLKNFDTDIQGECEWALGGNFAVRRYRFLQVGGFDKNFIGNALLEDADFCYRIREAGYIVFYSPLPGLEHLREPRGGVRSANRDKAMYYRSHNSVYFFRKHKSLWQLPLLLIYLNGIFIKDFIKSQHSLIALYYTWTGFLKGLTTSRL